MSEPPRPRGRFDQWPEQDGWVERLDLGFDGTCKETSGQVGLQGSDIDRSHGTYTVEAVRPEHTASEGAGAGPLPRPGEDWPGGEFEVVLRFTREVSGTDHAGLSPKSVDEARHLRVVRARVRVHRAGDERRLLLVTPHATYRAARLLGD